jgi:hypothetical protein
MRHQQKLSNAGAKSLVGGGGAKRWLPICRPPTLIPGPDGEELLDYAKGGHECPTMCSTRRGASSAIANMMPDLRVEAKSSPAK